MSLQVLKEFCAEKVDSSLLEDRCLCSFPKVGLDGADEMVDGVNVLKAGPEVEEAYVGAAHKLGIVDWNIEAHGKVVN